MRLAVYDGAIPPVRRHDIKSEPGSEVDEIVEVGDRELVCLQARIILEKGQRNERDACLTVISGPSLVYLEKVCDSPYISLEAYATLGRVKFDEVVV